jgi:hypothetical protein
MPKWLLELREVDVSVIDNELCKWLYQVSNPLNFFSSTLMTRPNKLQGLPLVTFSSQVLEFEGKARANPIGGPFRCSTLG